VAQQGLVIVAGLGEVGKPLLRILSRTFECAGIDVDPSVIDRPCSVLHICYPFQIARFAEVTVEYVRELRPALTVIHSSVPPGTTREIQEFAGDTPIAYSPVRGKHARMIDDMQRYRKFVAAPTRGGLEAARDHLSMAGFRTATMPSPELAELAKLLETTYLGVLIAWTQEMERIAMRYGGDFKDVNSFVEEVNFLPSHIFPGVIGGHCVLPNIDLLRSQLESPFLDLIVESNSLKIQQPVAAGVGVTHDQDRTDRVGVLGA
jgi:UDP-N-acetyl-D-mannosaminuronate dehydrogenase